MNLDEKIMNMHDFVCTYRERERVCGIDLIRFEETGNPHKTLCV